MAITSPDELVYPEAGQALPPLESHFASLAQSTQEALNTLRASTAPPVASAAARNALYPNPVQGNTVDRLDRGWVERYYGEFSTSANPGGASPAGWYPISGAVPFVSFDVANASLGSGGEVEIGLGTVTSVEDRLGMRGTSGVSQYRITPSVAGWYQTSLIVSFPSAAAGVRIISIRKNGDGAFGNTARIANNGYGVGNGATEAVGTMYMNGTTDYFAFFAWQDSGPTMTGISWSVRSVYLRPKAV